MEADQLLSTKRTKPNYKCHSIATHTYSAVNEPYVYLLPDLTSRPKSQDGRFARDRPSPRLVPGPRASM
jgi:hypothetical protein